MKGEIVKVNYHNDDTWRHVQGFLPPQNRLTADNMPDESFVQVDNIKIHIGFIQKC